MSQYIVRYGSLRLLGVFSTSREETFVRNVQVLARTERGVEIGEVLCEATERAVQNLHDTKGGQILREVSSEDR
ncbi:MAG: signal peptidase, partial [Pirellulales bacterium]|nr:signal peptidase [Pirellulales bacterium]